MCNSAKKLCRDILCYVIQHYRLHQTLWKGNIKGESRWDIANVRSKDKASSCTHFRKESDPGYLFLFSTLRNQRNWVRSHRFRLSHLPLGIKARNNRRYVFWKTKKKIYRRYNWNEQVFLFISLEGRRERRGGRNQRELVEREKSFTIELLRSGDEEAIREREETDLYSLCRPSS